jgi:DNA-binding response OmpR family regulator
VDVTGVTIGQSMAVRPKILIVEDDIPVAMMLTCLLAQAGIETEAATTGKKALQMAADGHFDLMTLDVDLPDISGYEVCRRLKENPYFQTPIVFVSGRLCPQDVQHGLELGAVDYITKPFETLEFAPRLLSHIGGKDSYHSTTIPKSVTK